MDERFDTFIIGQPALDVNTDYDGTVVHAFGGAVVFSSFAAGALGHRTAVLAKACLQEVDMQAVFAGAQNVTVYPCDSKKSTAIHNTYFTPDRERRTQTVESSIDPYRAEEIPYLNAAVYHLAGLMHGDIPETLIGVCAKRAKVAIDVQCLLRHNENGRMAFHDWANKRAYLPLIDFLKTDAAEAEILTGRTDRADAARQLCDWGAREVMVTHNSEVLVYNGRRVYTEPIRSRNLSGRTGRGDTTFAGYINERLCHDVPASLLTATALVSLKMERPGPFAGTRQDVLDYIEAFYR